MNKKNLIFIFHPQQKIHKPQIQHEFPYLQEIEFDTCSFPLNKKKKKKSSL